MYKCLTPEEKATWEARAQQDKARFDMEMSHYIPAPGHDSMGNLIEDHRIARKVKKTRDPDAPKRARGSFVFFTFDVRPRIVEEYPGIKFIEMGNVMGQRWRDLTPEEKKKYEDLAADDKVRFNDEMQKYMATKSAASPAAAVAHMPAATHDMYGMGQMDHAQQYDHNAYHHQAQYGYDQYQYHG